MPTEAPEAGESFEAIIADVEKLILPAVTNWNHPNFHGLFSTSTSGPGILGETLSAAFDMKSMLWRTAPASTELEDVTLGWLRQMLGLPEAFEGIIYDTASVSTMHAIAAARERAGLNIRELGMSGRPDLPLLCIYASEHVHSSIDKACITLGLGTRSLRKIACNERFEMRAAELRRAIEEDVAAGHSRSALSRPSARRRQPALIRSARSRKLRKSSGFGCTLTPPTRGRGARRKAAFLCGLGAGGFDRAEPA